MTKTPTIIVTFSNSKQHYISKVKNFQNEANKTHTSHVFCCCFLGGGGGGEGCKTYRALTVNTVIEFMQKTDATAKPGKFLSQSQ